MERAESSLLITVNSGAQPGPAYSGLRTQAVHIHPGVRSKPKSFYTDEKYVFPLECLQLMCLCRLESVVLPSVGASSASIHGAIGGGGGGAGVSRFGSADGSLHRSRSSFLRRGRSLSPESLSRARSSAVEASATISPQDRSSILRKVSCTVFFSVIFSHCYVDSIKGHLPE